MGEENPPAVETIDDHLAVEADMAALSRRSSESEGGPTIKLVTFDQILVDGKLAGPPAELMAKRPELIPAIVALFKAREAKLVDYHGAQLAKLQTDLAEAKSP